MEIVLTWIDYTLMGLIVLVAFITVIALIRKRHRQDKDNNIYIE